MKYEVFEKIITDIKTCSEKDTIIYKTGVDITNVIDPYSSIISLFFKVYYSEDGADWIDWFLYEKFDKDREPLTAQDKDGNEICRTLKELWVIVEEIRCSSDFKEYILPKELSLDERMDIFKKIFE